MKNYLEDVYVISNCRKKKFFNWKLILFLLLSLNVFFGCFSSVYGQIKIEKMTYEQFIKANVPDKTELDIFLNNSGTWAQFSPGNGLHFRKFNAT